MATCSSILAWRIPWTEEPGGLWSRDCKELNTTERLTPSCCRAQFLGCTGSVVVAHGLSCPIARGMFPEGRSDQCPWHWRAGSSPMSPREAPPPSFLSTHPLSSVALPCDAPAVSQDPLWHPPQSASRRTQLQVPPGVLGSQQGRGS